jgi:hypothetical protein
MKKLVTLLVLAAAAVSFNTAMAHGAKAKHGGVVATSSDLAFELASQGDTATLYVEDHGKPVSSTGMSGKLIVLNGADKSEVALAPAGDNKLEAKGVKLAPGAKAVATLNTAQQKTVTVRFSIK